MVIKAALLGQAIAALIVGVVLFKAIRSIGRRFQSAERQAAALERLATIAERDASVQPARRAASPPTTLP